jgi:hypothetical protein
MITESWEGGFKFSARKLRLFAVSCFQPYKTMLTDERFATVLTVAERFADGTASCRELAIARSDARQAFTEKRAPEDELKRAALAAATWRVPGVVLDDPLTPDRLVTAAEDAALYTPHRVARYRGLSVDLSYGDVYHHAYRAEEQAQAVLLRDIFRNPFRPVAFDPRWRSADVLGLARGIYEDRAFDRLPLLADALMDAGCADERVINHCRGEGPHVRGCWVVDLALNKE